MAKNLPFLPIFFFLFHFVHAQNYQPFRKGLTYQFVNSTRDTITSLKVDSVVQLNADSINYFNWTCSDAHSWVTIDSNNVFGYAMLQKSNGDYIFFTTSQDSFLIRTKIPVGTKWTFNQQRGIEAMYVSKTDTSFAGIKDSIMSISLGDGALLKLSKNYGFVQTVNFDCYFKKKYRSQLILDAIPEYKLGKFLSDPSVYFDFQPGDILMYDFEEQIIMPTYVGKIYKKILSRKDFGNDSIVYNISRTQVTRNYDTLFHSSGNLYQQGSYTFTIRLTPIADVNYNQEEIINSITTADYGMEANNFENLSTPSKALFLLTNQNLLEGRNEPVTNTKIYKDSIDKYLFEGYENSYLIKNPITTAVPIYDFASHVSSINDFESGFSKTYYPSLGTIYYKEWHSGDGLYYYVQHLACFIKNGIALGDCQGLDLFVLATQEQADTKIDIYPNPVNDVFFIKIKSLEQGEKNIRITNALGETIYKEKITSDDDNVRVESSSMKSGLYFIQIEGQKVYTTNFVKQ